MAAKDKAKAWLKELKEAVEQINEQKQMAVHQMVQDALDSGDRAKDLSDQPNSIVQSKPKIVLSRDQTSKIFVGCESFIQMHRTADHNSLVDTISNWIDARISAYGTVTRKMFRFSDEKSKVIEGFIPTPGTDFFFTVAVSTKNIKPKWSKMFRRASIFSKKENRLCEFYAISGEPVKWALSSTISPNINYISVSDPIAMLTMVRCILEAFEAGSANSDAPLRLEGPDADRNQA